MSQIRAFAAEDVPAVAGLFRTVLQKRDTPAPDDLRNYFSKLFLTGAFADPATPSLVATEDAGTITGFIGVTAQPMALGDRNVRAAIASTLMVQDHHKNPLTGALLMKAFLAGSQDISLTETAGAPSLAIWRQLGGRTLEAHSLDWMRVLRPAGMLVATARDRIKAAGMLSPLARMVDKRALKAGGPGEHRQWIGIASGFQPRLPVTVEDIGAGEFVTLLNTFTSLFALKPVWSTDALDQVGHDMSEKPPFGSCTLAVVRSKTGTPIGLLAYFLAKNGIARVLQVLARPGQYGVVIDALFSEAVRKGAVAIEGRSNPLLAAELMSRRCIFMHRSASAAHSKDATLIQMFERGEGMFNGLVGESWSRLYGGDFDRDKQGAARPAS